MRHEADDDLRCISCGEIGPWVPGTGCPAMPQSSRGWKDRDRLDWARGENSRAFAAAIEAHDALGGTPLTVEERLALRVSLGP